MRGLLPSLPKKEAFYAKVNMTILKSELIHLAESLQEVTDSSILLLNFDMSIIFGQKSHYFFYEFEKALFIFMFWKLKCVPESEKSLLLHHMPSCLFDTLSLEISQVCRLLIYKLSTAKKGSGYLKLSHRPWQISHSE